MYRTFPMLVVTRTCAHARNLGTMTRSLWGHLLQPYWFRVVLYSRPHLDGIRLGCWCCMYKIYAHACEEGMVGAGWEPWWWWRPLLRRCSIFYCFFSCAEVKCEVFFSVSSTVFFCFCFPSAWKGAEAHEWCYTERSGIWSRVLWHLSIFSYNIQ